MNGETCYILRPVKEKRKGYCIRTDVKEVVERLEVAVIKAGGDKKQELIAEYRKHDKDSGSTEIQVALLTARIAHLTGHLQVHKKDHASRRGLLMLVGQRSRLLKHLAAVSLPQYQALIKRLGLRR